MEILIEKGTIHELPDDMKDMLSKNNVIVKQWNNLTPLARNERICRVTIVKKPETRASHIQRLCEDLLKGKRRPCCRPGCPHHRPDAQKWFGK